MESSGAAEDAKRFLSVFRKELSQPELYLEPSNALKAKCLAGVKLLFTCVKQGGGGLPTGPLHQLYTADFDADQVWEELQLANEPAMNSLCGVVEGMEAGLQLVVAEEEAGEEEGEEEGDIIEDKESVAEMQSADSGGVFYSMSAPATEFVSVASQERRGTLVWTVKTLGQKT